MERMMTREKKNPPTRNYSPPRQQTLPKKTKKSPKSTKKDKNTDQSTIKSKKKSQKKARTIDLKGNSTKEIEIEAPKNVTKKKSSNNNDEDTLIMPENLRAVIPNDIWNSWSNIRRASFKQIMKNPNSFFYRNRPPGDPQKYGPFTAAEEKQFIERLKYFREELGVNEGLWGYFSVPILGRLGYQCSNFYRSLIASGKIVDSSYELMPDGKLRYLYGGTKIGGDKLPQKVMSILDKEAFAFIKKCFDAAKEEGETPKVLKPITVGQEKSESEDTKNEDDSESEKNEIIIQIRRSDVITNEKNFLIHFNSKALNNGKKRIVLSENSKDDLNNFHSRNRRKNRFIYKSSLGSKGRNRTGYEFSSSNFDNSDCPIVGAIDPFSNLPIEKPMMDPIGVVMDQSSWKKIFSQKLLPPFEIAAFSMKDLIELNSSNFDEYRFYISNFVC